MFDKIAKILLKAFIYVAILSFLVSFANIVPVYMQLRSAANAILIDATLNNYIIAEDVTDVIDGYFVAPEGMKNMICNSSNPCELDTDLSKSWLNSGVYLYMSLAEDMADFPMASQSSGDKTGSARRVLLPEASPFKPKSDAADAVIFKNTYHGANRGAKITVRLDTKVKFNLYLFGMNYQLGFPITTGEMSAPAMYYYRHLDAEV